MIDVSIDPEFQNTIPPLSIDEYNGLQESILKEGCRDPIVLWNGLIIDGHNRYKICKEHNIEFRISDHSVNLKTREEVIDWIYSNQLSRRNLAPDQSAYLIGKQYELRKKMRGGQIPYIKSMGQNDLSSTAEKIADEQHVSEKTVKRDAEYSVAVDTVVKNVGIETVKQKILTGEIKSARADIIELAKIDPSTQKEVIAKALEREDSNVKSILREHKYRKNGHTKTSSFGVSSRVGHDSSEYYARKMNTEDLILPKVESATTEKSIVATLIPDICYCSSSEQMKEIPDNSIHLMITSPPYNVGKDYDEDHSLEEYLKLLTTVFTEVYRVLVVGGRACINIANVGRKPYIPLNCFISHIMHQIGFLQRGEVIWNKGASVGVSAAWGSWKSASNPILRDVHEYILIFSKGEYGREPGYSTITKDEYLEYTKSIWNFSSVSAKKIGHPAPFPIELPKRLIKLYSYEDDVILDPFLGSGQTAIAAKNLKRHYIGYDIQSEYIDQAKARIESGEEC